MAAVSPSLPQAIAPSVDAPQHRPRPLPLFLHMLRSEAGDDPARTAAVLNGLRAYQQAPRQARDMAPIVAQVGRASLRGFGGSGPPVVFVPSLINGAEILDLDPERSLLRWLATQGVAPLLVDWGCPTGKDRTLGIANHVERLLVPLLDALDAPPILVGYCLGGTMAIAAATLRAPRALATIATPWHFSRYPDRSRAALAELWQEAEAPAQSIGLLPMDVLQLAFWRLDPGRTLDKYAALGAVADDGEAVRRFVAVEDWANGGPPLTLAAARELVEALFGADATGCGTWSAGGCIVDPSALTMPFLEIVSTSDRIVPAASAAACGERRSLGLGHVGMIVGSRARKAVWEPLAAWLKAVGS